MFAGPSSRDDSTNYDIVEVRPIRVDERQDLAVGHTRCHETLLAILAAIVSTEQHRAVEDQRCEFELKPAVDESPVVLCRVPVEPPRRKIHFVYTISKGGGPRSNLLCSGSPLCPSARSPNPRARQQPSPRNGCRSPTRQTAVGSVCAGRGAHPARGRPTPQSNTAARPEGGPERGPRAGSRRQPVLRGVCCLVHREQCPGRSNIGSGRFCLIARCRFAGKTPAFGASSTGFSALSGRCWKRCRSGRRRVPQLQLELTVDRPC